ncbi:hypothetical protein [Glycomyces dulcitolivorans]|uniref:hypothetical protein n=1 Tax=Glycomyces dulcitolivorans TaxID=2200759 RepID=UPI000DD32236|nr:hypothetical protein [Glycomyces dulcitolivorans]
MTDPTMEAVTSAVTEAQTGDRTAAKRRLLDLWDALSPTGDPLARCTLAHHLADLYDDPAEALTWDIRALDAADALTDARLQEHAAGLQVAGFYPSLHLNLADAYRRLASFEAAQRHIDAARACSPALADDPYGRLITAAITRTADAIARKDTSSPLTPSSTG